MLGSLYTKVQKKIYRRLNWKWKKAIEWEREKEALCSQDSRLESPLTLPFRRVGMLSLGAAQ